MTKSVGGADWSAHNGVQFWIKSGQAGRGVTIQMKDASGEYWEAKLFLDNTDGSVVNIPLSAFHLAGYQNVQTNGILELSSIKEFSIYVDRGSIGNGPGTLFVDDIQAVSLREIDNFDFYSNNDAKVLTDYVRDQWGDEMTASIENDTKQAGKHALKLAYTLTDEKGYAGVKRTLGDLNISSGGNALSFWLKSNQAGHGLTFQLTESDGDIWEAQTTIASTEGSVIQIPFGGFARNKQWSTGDGKLNRAAIASYAIFVNKGVGQAGANTIYIDSIAVDLVPTIDDFDYYGAGELVAGGTYTTNPWGGDVTLTPVSDHKEAGPAGGKYAYDFKTTDFAGVNKQLGSLDWRAYEGIRLWLKKDASNNRLVVQFLESDGTGWESNIMLTDDKSGVLTLPFNTFTKASWSSGDNIIDLDAVKEFSIYVNQGSAETPKQGTLYFDTIKVYKAGEEPDPSTDPGTNPDPNPQRRREAFQHLALLKKTT